MLITVAAIVAAVLAVALIAGVRWWMWRPVVSNRVVVQTGATAFNGVVLSRRGPLIVLGDVTVHTGGKVNKIDGTTVIERHRVDWYQVVG